jgi:hypothetical protein
MLEKHMKKARAVPIPRRDRDGGALGRGDLGTGGCSSGRGPMLHRRRGWPEKKSFC